LQNLQILNCILEKLKTIKIYQYLCFITWIFRAWETFEAQ
jgi:hypothetical protein